MPKKRHRIKRINYRGTVEHHDEAIRRLAEPEDCVVVYRSVSRELVMKCPCGCGDTLTINLDPRAGAAWKLYVRGDSLSLHPSVWRESGCESHFMLIGSRIYGFGFSSISDIDRNDEFIMRVVKLFEDSAVNSDSSSRARRK